MMNRPKLRRKESRAGGLILVVQSRWGKLKLKLLGEGPSHLPLDFWVAPEIPGSGWLPCGLRSTYSLPFSLSPRDERYTVGAYKNSKNSMNSTFRTTQHITSHQVVTSARHRLR